MLKPGFALILPAAACAALTLSSCMTAYKESVGVTETEQLFSRVFLTDFNTAWQSSLDALKSSRLDVSNRDAGFIQTKWSDNTVERNFTDSFGSADTVIKAQFRFKLSVSKAFFNGRPAIKVAIRKDQVIERDVLDGPRRIETDTIDENTLLYRIGRIIFIRSKIAQMEEEKTSKAIDKQGF